MDDLLELIRVIQKTKFRTDRLIDSILTEGSQIHMLYEALAAGSVSTDDEARSLVALQNVNITVLKSKLKDRLILSVLLLDFKESAYAERQRAFVEAAQKWSAALILLSKNARGNAIGLLEQLLRHTQRFEFTELSLEILRSLRLHYGAIEGDFKKYDYYEQQLTALEEVWQLERRIEKWYIELITHFVRQKSDNKGFAEKVANYWDGIQPILEQSSVFKVQFFGRLIGMMYFDNQKKYKDSIALCNDSIIFFKEKPYFSAVAIQAFHYNLLVGNFKLGFYEICLNECLNIDKLYEKGAFNWFKVQEVHFLSSMHSGFYTQAEQILQESIQHPEWQRQSAPIRELWLIFSAYSGLMSWFYNPVKEKFRIKKFLNDIQVFTKDKSGMNIPVTIIQFLWYLADGALDEFRERVESLAKYRTRYVDGALQSRTAYFIKMLEVLPRINFDPSLAATRTASLWQQLKLQQSANSGESYEIEIVPYEVLWEFVIDALKRLKPNSKSKQELS